MSRLINDVFHVGKSVWNMSSDYVKIGILRCGYSIAIGVSKTVITLSSTMTHKLIRGITKDPTSYADWNDLQDQINRLATNSFKDMRGALAPATIFDRRVLDFSELYSKLDLIKSSLNSNGTYILGTTAALALVASSHSECVQNGDSSNPNLSEVCWDHLGYLSREPSLLLTIILLYTIAKTSIISRILPITTNLSLTIFESLANGYEITRFPYLKNKTAFLLERYTALGTELTKQWNEAKEKDFSKKDSLIKTAQLLQVRSRLISASLEESFYLKKEESEKIVEPLINAAKLILKENNIKF